MPITKHIDIPVPCSEQWGQMHQSDGGRFCNQCHKTVIDFTGLTNQQIIDIVSGSSKICGRFDSWQLASINNTLNRDAVATTSNIWKRIAVAATVIWSLSFLKAEAQFKPATTQQPVTKNDIKPVDTPTDAVTYRTITGKVIDAQSKLPVAYATIHTASAGVPSNSSGDFKIRVPSTTKSIEVLSIGYIKSIIQLDEKSDYQIPIVENLNMLLGEVVAPSLKQKLGNK